jgi:hypothetical protein
VLGGRIQAPVEIGRSLADFEKYLRESGRAATAQPMA